MPSDDEIVQDGRVFAANCEYMDGRCVRLDFTPHRLVAFVRAALAAQQAEREPLAKAVVDAARAAMDESVEACNEQMDIAIPAHLAATLSLCLDEHDRAHGIGHHVPVQGSGE